MACSYMTLCSLLGLCLARKLYVISPVNNPQIETFKVQIESSDRSLNYMNVRPQSQV